MMKPMDSSSRAEERIDCARNSSPHLNPAASLARSIILSMAVMTLAACDIGGGSSDGSGDRDAPPAVIPPAATSFELLDPTPAAGDRFGQSVEILATGNIVVSDVFDSDFATGNGAVHLYDPVSQSIIASIYGDNANDNLGSGGIFPLVNGNFVIVSPLDDVGLSDNGSVRLVNGTDGTTIGTPITGDAASDQIGNLGGITELSNGNFVIASPLESDGASFAAGTVRLVNGANGTQIGATIAGNAIFDTLALGGIVPLGNGNFVINSPADAGGVGTAGSVMLVNGGSGALIATFVGDNPGDQLGLGGVIALSNDNFVIASPLDDATVVNGGTIMLIDGTFGIQIGTTLEGDTTEDRLGFSIITGVKALANGNFVVSSSFDDETFVDGGTVRLVSGTSGLQLGTTIEGASANEQLELVTVHANNTFMVASPLADNGGDADVGSLGLYSGVDASQIGTTFMGDFADDQIGLGSVIQLANNNYAIASINDDEGGIVDAGSIMLWDGTTGSQVGTTIAGNAMTDQLGFGPIIALSNNNFVVASLFDDDGANADAGSVRLVNGATGAEIVSIAGDFANDMQGSGGLVALANGNFVILSDVDDEGGNADVGSVRLIDGATGAAIGSPFIGTAANDLSEAVVVAATAGGDYVLGLSRSDKDGLVDSGQAFLFTD